jgi:hypothetical protein
MDVSTGMTLVNIDAIREAAIAADTFAIKQAGLASSLKDATGAQVAQAAISELGGLLAEDKITIDEYKTAVTQTQLAFGLADEASIRLSEGVLDLVSKFGEGKVGADKFDESLLSLFTATENQRAATMELGAAIEALPTEKTVRINVEYAGGGLGPGSITAGGGTVTNNTSTTINQTVNTQATTSTVVHDLATAMALTQ